MEGYLHKRGDNRGSSSPCALGLPTWKKRYFKLEGSCLSYYESRAGAPKGEVDVAFGAVDGSPRFVFPFGRSTGDWKRAKTSGFTFAITTDAGRMLLEADTAELRGKWLDAIQAAITCVALLDEASSDH